MECGSRGFLAAQLRQQLQHLAQVHVAIAQQVALTDASALGRQQVSCGDGADVHKVQARVEIRRHLALQKI